MKLNYNYNLSKKHCENIGLTWFGDDHPSVIRMDQTAKKMKLTQSQVTELTKQHLDQVNYLFNPRNYKWAYRVWFAVYFLTGFRLK